LHVLCCVAMWLTAASIDSGLVALVFKGSQGWEGTSYTAIISTVGGSTTVLGILIFVLLDWNWS